METAVKYATEYEAKRAKSPYWLAEHDAVEKLTAYHQPGSFVLDCPSGTGRYWPIYTRRGWHPVGIDISQAMVDQAASKGIQTDTGTVFNLPFPDHHFDVAVCSRLAWWLTPDDLPRAIGELLRVSAELVLSVRIGDEGIPHGRNTMTHRIETITECADIKESIEIWRNRTGSYRFLLLR